MHLADIVAEKKKYEKYFFKKYDKVTLGVVGLYAGWFVRMMLAIFHIILPSMTLELAGIAGFLIWGLIQVEKSADKCYKHYQGLLAETIVEFTNKSYIEITGEKREEIPWERGRRIDEVDDCYVIAFLERLIMLIDKTKLTEKDREIIEAAKNIASTINLQDMKMPFLSKEQQVYYIEMTWERWLRARKSFSTFKESVKMTVCTLFAICGYLSFTQDFKILIGVPVTLIIVKYKAKRDEVISYDKERLSYMLIVDHEKGIIIKNISEEKYVSWDQLCKITETKKDYLLYLDETHRILLPKDIMTNEEIKWFKMQKEEL